MAAKVVSFAIVAAMAALLGACQGSNAPAASDAAAARPDGAQLTFQSPPVVDRVETAANGGAILHGRAAPDSRVRAVTTDPASIGATTGHDGRFRLDLPPVGRTRLVMLSMEGANRSTGAAGWLFLPPDAPSQAVMLRPGAAAAPLAGAGLLAVIDYDPKGGVATAGRTSPNATVVVSVDSGAETQIRADAGGLWTLRLSTPLPPGAHDFHAHIGAMRVDRHVVLSARQVPGVFEAVREAGDWRVDWTPQGGGAQDKGAQTTLVLTGPAA